MSLLRDTEPSLGLRLIDARAPRFNQAVIGLAALMAFALDFWPLLTLAAAQLALALFLGPQACLACAIYFKLVRPRLGPGPMKDARPVRFANWVGLVILSAASVAHMARLPGLGWGLGLLVAGLALLAAATGFCVGCEVYRLWAGLRGIGPRRVAHIDLRENRSGTPARSGSRVLAPTVHRLPHASRIPSRSGRAGGPGGCFPESRIGPQIRDQSCAPGVRGRHQWARPVSSRRLDRIAQTPAGRAGPARQRAGAR